MNYESGWERLRESVFLLMLFGLIALASIVALLLLLLSPLVLLVSLLIALPAYIRATLTSTSDESERTQETHSV
jgi:hypothetical protein